MHVDERADAQQDESHEPAPRHRREERHDRDRREEVALVDARRQHEEADGEHGQGHDEGPAVVADRRAGQRPQVPAREQGRPDGEGRDGSEERHVVARPRQAIGERRVAARAHERPGVEGVDREVRVAARRVPDEPQVARDIEAERERDDVEDDEADHE